MSTAQLFDIAAALIIVTLGFIGFLRGFVGAVMSLIGLSCGIYFAGLYSEEGTAMFLVYFPTADGTMAKIAAMAIIFLGVAIIASLLSKLLSSLIKFANLSSINHLAGMLIGFATGSVLIIMIYAAIINITPGIGEGWINDSIFMGFAANIWPQIDEFLKSYGIDTMNIVSKTV